jgi:hypothetical protein
MEPHPKADPVETTIQYEYTSLDLRLRQICLVTLLPGNWRDDIHCEMTVAKFGKKMPKYEALSYVWGDPMVTHAIWVNDQIFSFGENLWIELRRLRNPHSLRFLWIDAIYIHQRDDSEKSTQVAMMREIFESCDQVICWLGEDGIITSHDTSSLTPTSIAGQQAFQLIRIYASEGSLDHISWCGPGSLSEFASSKEYGPHFKALEQIMTVPCWQRIWIVQELVLPPRATFVYGSEICDFDIFVCAVTRFDYNYRVYFKSLHRYTCNSSVRQITVRILDTVLPLMQMGKLRLSKIGLQPVFKGITILRSLLCSLHATDQRDLFYGLLSLTRRPDIMDHSYLPDYNLKFPTAICRIAVADIRDTEDLSILTGTRYPATNLDDALNVHRPTWLASSRITTLDSALAVTTRRYFRAINPFKASQNFYSQVDLINNWRLRLKSISLGKVTLVGEAFKSSLDDDAFNVPILHRSLQLLGLDHPSHWPQDVPSLGSWQDSFWRTFMSNRMRIQDLVLPQSPEAQDYSNVRGLFISTIEGTKLSYIEDHQLSRCLIILAHRALIVMKDGSMGSAPLQALPGDEVHILIGAKVPFILRRQTAGTGLLNDNNFEFPSYTVIGDGYLHGVMEGEAIEGRNEECWETVELW